MYAKLIDCDGELYHSAIIKRRRIIIDKLMGTMDGWISLGPQNDVKHSEVRTVAPYHTILHHSIYVPYRVTRDKDFVNEIHFNISLSCAQWKINWKPISREKSNKKKYIKSIKKIQNPYKKCRGEPWIIWTEIGRRHKACWNFGYEYHSLASYVCFPFSF